VEITLGDEQEFFRDTTRRFLGAECPIATVRELATDDAGFDPSFWASGAELGWTCLLVAERDGGGSLTDNGVVDLTIVADAFGRNVAPGPLLPVNVVADAISRRGAKRSAMRCCPACCRVPRSQAGAARSMHWISPLSAQ